MATTTTKCEETLVDWLRDAHAMEKQAEQMLSNTAKRIEHYPELKSKIETHLDQTRRQAELVKGCLERHGESTSTLKDTAGSIAEQHQVLAQEAHLLGGPGGQLRAGRHRPPVAAQQVAGRRVRSDSR